MAPHFASARCNAVKIPIVCQKKGKKMNKTYSGHHQYTEAAIVADSAVIWCPVSILSQTTSMNVALNTTLEVFSSRKSVFHAAEGAGDIIGMEAPLAVLQDLGGSSLKHERCSNVSPQAAKKINCKQGLGANY